MKKQLVALAVAGAFCSLAHADGGVTVYGTLDAGLMYASKAPTAVGLANCSVAANGRTIFTNYQPNPSNPPCTTGSMTAFNDSQMAPSVYGLKGGEDLGGGLKVNFDLEGGFNTGTGTVNNEGTGGIFGRQANLGLSGSWGAVTAGMQFDPAFVAALSTEPRGMVDALSSLDIWAGTLIGSQSPNVLAGGIFDQNAISYSYEGNGLWIGVLYGFGGIAGCSSCGAEESLGVTWTGSGVTVAAGFTKGNQNQIGSPANNNYSGTGTEIWHIGAGYATGPFAARLQYTDYKSDYFNPGVGSPNSSPGLETKEIGVGFDWKVGANTANLAYYNVKGDGGIVDATGGKTTEIALMDNYALSKRTSMYAQIASVKVDAFTGTSGPGLSGTIGGTYSGVGNTAVPGATTTFIGLGMQHNF